MRCASAARSQTPGIPSFPGDPKRLSGGLAYSRMNGPMLGSSEAGARKSSTLPAGRLHELGLRGMNPGRG